MGAIHCLVPGVGAIDALLKRSDAALDLPRNQFVAKSHPPLCLGWRLKSIILAINLTKRLALGLRENDA